MQAFLLRLVFHSLNMFLLFPESCRSGFFWEKLCHQRLPKFCWSDGCLWRVSSKTAKVLLKWWLSLKGVIEDCQSSAEVMAVFEECHRRLPKLCWSDGCLERMSSQTAKVLLKWWLSLKGVIKDCQSSAEVMAVFEECHRRLPKFCWSDGSLWRVPSKTAKVLLKWWLSSKSVIQDCQSCAEVMAVFKECHRRLPKFCWSDGCL